MRILIITPAPPGTRLGNRMTANRWAKLLRELGHRVSVENSFFGQSVELLIALHAQKSADAIHGFQRRHPGVPVVLAMTGTDLYRDLPSSQLAKRSIELADRVVVLQENAINILPKSARTKTRVIVQSAVPPKRRLKVRKDVFEICVLGHLRAEKDPFRAALAVRFLPRTSRIQITHVGSALSQAMQQRAFEEAANNPRYTWMGDLPHGRAMQILARSRVLINSSLMEGGANAICEAIACGVPVLSSKIPGSTGLLGRKYPGYFEVENTTGLAKLLNRVESDETFLNELRHHCEALAPLVSPENELTAWRDLLQELE